MMDMYVINLEFSVAHILSAILEKSGLLISIVLSWV